MSLTDKNTEIEKLKKIISALPDKPGVYQYFDKNETIIYVGKAKSLKKRVSSYFTNIQSHSGKLKVLVSKIADIKIVVVESEMDALLLENNLIKKYQPRYNVLLKDDKTFPWICVKNEPFPRIFQTRNLVRDGSFYFGPYTSLKMMHTLMDLIRKLYPLRTCNFQLSPENIKANKFKVCLEYHIKNCKGPCEGLQDAEEYQQNIKEIKDILKGNSNTVLNHLKEMMAHYAQNLEFEKAHLVKEKIELIEKHQSKSTIVNPEIHNVDVYSILSDEKSAYVNFLKIINGAVIQAHTVEIKKRLDESDEELLLFAITDISQRFESNSHEIVLPFEIEVPNKKITVPKIGDKKKLLELSERNARYYKLEMSRRSDGTPQEIRDRRVLEQMKSDLRMNELPDYIECFDNSNIQGQYPVSSLVVFRNARPSKKDYRIFHVKTVEGPNDFATMEEVILRRYSRLVEENQELPKLIVIDGGKGQLSSACESLRKVGILDKVKVLGIAKRLEELFFPGDPYPLYLDKKSETLKVIQHIRDEAHRFGITHHRKLREKGTIKTEITGIEGIGPKTAQVLLNHFKSVEQIKKQSLESLEEVVGKDKAVKVFEYFREG